MIDTAEEDFGGRASSERAEREAELDRDFAPVDQAAFVLARFHRGETAEDIALDRGETASDVLEMVDRAARTRTASLTAERNDAVLLYGLDDVVRRVIVALDVDMQARDRAAMLDLLLRANQARHAAARSRPAGATAFEAARRALGKPTTGRRPPRPHQKKEQTR